MESDAISGWIVSELSRHPAGVENCLVMCGNSSLPQPHTHPLELGSESLEAETVSFRRNQKGQMSCLSASLAARALVPAPELGQSEVPIPDTKSGAIIYRGGNS